MEKYKLEQLDEELCNQHQEADASLRELEEYVNKRILERALEDVDIALLSGVDEVYRVLTATDVTAGEQAETQERLRQAGVDIDQIKEDFVTYQTVRTHLRQSLNIDTGVTTTFDIDNAQTTIRRLQSRSEAVITQTLNRLRTTGKIDTGDLDIVISVRATCHECGHSYRLRDLLMQGHCRCSSEKGTEQNIDQPQRDLDSEP